MKRIRVASFALGLAILAGLLMSASAVAHPVTVDGAIGDWFATAPITSPGAHPNSNTGQVARNPAQQGEFNWRDAALDQRIITATGTLTKEVDLRNFRVTADTANLYLFLHVEAATAINGPNAVEFQVGIDDGTGANSALVDGGATTPISTTVAAPWRYLVQTRFQNGTLSGGGGTTSSAAPRVYTTPATFSTAGTSGVLRRIGVDTAELKIPWSQVGGVPPAAGKRLRFSVATMYSDRAAPLPSDGVPNSRVMDTMSATQSAAADLADDQIGYAADVYFDSKGEVFSPLLITEFQPNAVGPDNTSAQDTEWIEIYNASALTIDLSGYKVGDAAKRLPAGGEGMFKFPAGATLVPGGIAIAANSKSKFSQVYPGVASLPNVAVYDPKPTTPAAFRLTKYAAWSNGDIITLLDGPAVGATSFEEQVVLLDGSDSIADIVTYKSSTLPNTGPYPGVVPITFQGSLIPESRSYERCPAGRDTNDASFDFIAHEGKPSQTPGAICAGTTALSLTKVAPATTAVGGQIDYSITYQNSGANDTNIFITDTLPLDAAYIDGSQSAPTVFGSAPIEFTDLGGGVLQWKLPLIGTGSGTISFAAQVANSQVLVGQTITNTAVIAGRLPDSDPADNTATATTRLTALPQVDVRIAKVLTSPPATLYTGRPAVYTISYSNTGDLPAANTLITDTIPAGLSFVAASPAPTLADSSKVVFDVGTVASAVDATIVLTFTVTASPAGGTPIANSAT
ncbi:MAG: lamin tail domain-containing protein, partial [Roseiflexaceae bacterium]